MCFFPHKFPELDEVNIALGSSWLVLSISPTKAVLCGEILHPKRGDPVGAQQYGSRSKGQSTFLPTIATSAILNHKGKDPDHLPFAILQS